MSFHSIKISILISFIIFSCANPAKADITDEYHNAVKNAWAEIRAFNYDKASGFANNSEILYRRSLSFYANKAEPERLWKWNLAQQITLVYLFNQLSERYESQANHEKQLHWIQKSIQINKTFPFTHVLKSKAYYSLRKPWESAVSCYEAKKLNRIPAQRKIVDHFDPDRTYEVDPNEIIDECNIILTSLNKPIEFPLNLNLPSGAPIKGAVLPGMGANILTKNNNWVNIYLGQNISELYASNEFPEPEFPEDNEEYLLPSISSSYEQWELNGHLILFDKSSEVVKRLCFFSSNYLLRTPYGDFRVGDHAKNLLNKIGNKLGFRRSYAELTDIREFFFYPEIGAEVDIGKNDKISSFCIDRLDSQVISSPIRFTPKDNNDKELSRTELTMIFK